jgi:ATP-dependent DNA ligase
MQLRMPREPMLAAPLTRPVPADWAVEPKWDGFRALLARRESGQVDLRSRRGTDMTRVFPEIAAAAATQLPPDTLVDGELVIWHRDRLAFEKLGQRLGRTPAAAARLAAETPAHFVVFDLLHQGERHWATRPYIERRAALEALFAEYRLTAPWTLCPATVASDQERIQTWLSWAAAGIEGLVIKDPRQRYLPGVRGWGKLRTRQSTEAVIGAVTGTLRRPASLLLGRFDSTSRLRYTGKTVPLSAQAAADTAALLSPAGPGHPWQGLTFSAGWGTRDTLDVTLVDPSLVAEVHADVSLDAAGRWRHPVRFGRIRADLTPADTPPFGTGNQPGSG